MPSEIQLKSPGGFAMLNLVRFAQNWNDGMVEYWNVEDPVFSEIDI
jgi:hypothetical protein